MSIQDGAYVEGYAIQVGSIWVAIPILEILSKQRIGLEWRWKGAA